MSKQKGMMKRLTQLGLLLMLGTSITGCATTVGQEFRDIMADIDAECKREGLGPYLDTSKPQPLSKITNTRCEILRVKPADPLATEEGRFAYSIKLPAPHDKLKTEYRSGMSAESYFKQLCEKDAGDFVFRAVDGVDGIKILRPFPQKSLPFWAEMTASTQLALWETAASSLAEKVYSYVDAVEFVQPTPSTTTQLIHYSLDEALPKSAPEFGIARSRIKESQAHYGYLFRAVNLPQDAAENGIKGGELIILNIQTKEIIAFRRTFTLMHFVHHKSPEMVSGKICMNVPYQKSGYQFIAEVLKSAKQANGETK